MKILLELIEVDLKLDASVKLVKKTVKSLQYRLRLISRHLLDLVVELFANSFIDPVG